MSRASPEWALVNDAHRIERTFRFADAGTTGDDQHLTGQRLTDRNRLAVGKCEFEALSDPRQGFVGLNPRPRKRAR
jgi:hypothetical protein